MKEASKCKDAPEHEEGKAENGDQEVTYLCPLITVRLILIDRVPQPPVPNGTKVPRDSSTH